MAFSRIQPLVPSPANFNQLLITWVDTLQRSLGEAIDIHLDLKPGIWPAWVDQNQMESALLNLAINAGHAMPEGGQLTIGCENVAGDALPTLTNVELTPGDYVCLVVKDTGIGIPPSDLEKIFEPFFTTKPVGAGSGLGLSMVFGFVNQSDGNLSVSSQLGVGTEVRLYLPRYGGDVERTTVASTESGTETPPIQRGHGDVILVVEDDLAVRDSTLGMLEILGYQTFDGQEGQVISNQENICGDVDILLTDIVLPGALDGFNLAEIAKEKNPNIKVVMMTGYADSLTHPAATNAPGGSILNKPFSLHSLASALADALRGQ